MVAHIRRNVPPRRGNQFYRDLNVRRQLTFCGEPVTSYDAAWNTSGIGYPFKNDTGEVSLCADCISVRAKATR